MKNFNETRYIDPITMHNALVRGRQERSRAFHQLWRAAVNSIR